MVCHTGESNNPRVCQIDPLSDGVYKHSKILNPPGRFEIPFPLVNDNSQVLVKTKEELAMFEETKNQLHHDKPIIQISEQIVLPPVNHSNTG